MPLRAAHVLALLAAANSLMICTADTTAAGETPACPRVPPTRYLVDVERYRFGGTCDPRNPAFYPIPREAVSRESYLRCIDALNPAEIARHPNRGMDGPRVFMPVLVKYVATGDSAWGDACLAMLQAFHAGMQKQVAERKWFWQFEHPAALIPLYRQYLEIGRASCRERV